MISKKINAILMLTAPILFSGCSTYMAPWQKPNPYHYEVMAPAPTIEYKPASSIEFQNKNFIPVEYIGPTNDDQPVYRNSKQQSRPVTPNSSIRNNQNESSSQVIEYQPTNAQPVYQDSGYISIPVE